MLYFCDCVVVVV